MKDPVKIKYESASFFLVRTALLPKAHYSSACYQTEETLSNFLIKIFHENLSFHNAIQLASPNLYAETRKCVDNNILIPPRITKGLLKYFLRSTSRATPYGLFGAVSWGAFLDKTVLPSHQPISTYCHPDQEWLDTLHKKKNAQIENLRSLEVMRHPFISSENGRFQIIQMRKKEEQNKLEEVSVSQTDFSSKVLELTTEAIPYRALEEKLLATYGTEQADKIYSGLFSIFQKGFLISNTSPHLHDKTYYRKHVDTAILDSLEKCDGNTQEGSQYLEKAQAFMKSEAAVDYPIQADSFRKETFSLAPTVKKELEEAAEALMALASQAGQQAKDPLQEYHHNFLEKYGTNRLVPVLECINPTIGLGPLPLTKEAPSQQALVSIFLSGMLKTKVKEIRLEPSDIFSTKTENFPRDPPRSIELFVEKTKDYLVINPTSLSLQGGSSVGRFAYLLTEDHIHELKAFFKKEEQDAKVIVEASFFPSASRTSNVSFYKKLRSYSLPLHFHYKDETTLSLDDIFIGSNLDKLYLYSKSLRKEIALVLATAVNPNLAPPSLQLLLEISKQESSSFSPFSWIPLEQQYVPRIVYKNTVLYPSRWIISREELELKKEDSFEKFRNKLKEKLQRLHVPRQVYLTHHDNRLLICWDDDQHLDLAVQHLRKEEEPLILFEALSPQQKANNPQEHVTEYVVPLIQKRDANKKESPETFPSLNTLPSKDRVYTATDNWIYSKVYLPTAHEESLLANSLSKISNILYEGGDIQHWHYIRYHDDRPHIRLRMRSDKSEIIPDLFYELSSIFSRMLKEEKIQDFSFHPFEKEIERYGGPHFFPHVEDFFCADSRFCALLLQNKKQSPITYAARFITLLLNEFYPKTSDQVQHLPAPPDSKHLLSGYRQELNQVFKWSFAPLGEEYTEFITAIRAFKKAFFENTDKISQWNQPNHLFDSLLHMHCNRVLGTDLELEKRARMLALQVIKRKTVYQK